MGFLCGPDLTGPVLSLASGPEKIVLHINLLCRRLHVEFQFTPRALAPSSFIIAARLRRLGGFFFSLRGCVDLHALHTKTKKPYGICKLHAPVGLHGF